MNVRALALVLAAPLILLMTPVLAAPPAIKVLDTGTGAKAALRYAPKVGARQQMTMTMRMKTAMSVGGRPAPSQSMPPIVMKMDTVVSSVSPERTITYAFEYSSMSIEDDKDANPALLEAMRKALRGMVGLKGETTITDRGFNERVELEVPKSADPMLKQTIESMKKSMKQIAVPLPEEPVGKGAKWKVTANVTEGMIRLTQISTVHLKSEPGREILLEVALEQEAGRQQMKHPGMPADAKVELLSLRGSGTGQINQDLTHIVPAASSAKSSHEVVMQTEAKGSPGMRMKMETTLDVKIVGGKTAEGAR